MTIFVFLFNIGCWFATGFFVSSIIRTRRIIKKLKALEVRGDNLDYCDGYLEALKDL